MATNELILESQRIERWKEYMYILLAVGDVPYYPLSEWFYYPNIIIHPVFQDR